MLLGSHHLCLLLAAVLVGLISNADAFTYYQISATIAQGTTELQMSVSLAGLDVTHCPNDNSATVTIRYTPVSSTPAPLPFAIKCASDESCVENADGGVVVTRQCNLIGTVSETNINLAVEVPAGTSNPTFASVYVWYDVVAEISTVPGEVGQPGQAQPVAKVVYNPLTPYPFSEDVAIWFVPYGETVLDIDNTRMTKASSIDGSLRVRGLLDAISATGLAGPMKVYAALNCPTQKVYEVPASKLYEYDVSSDPKSERLPITDTPVGSADSIFLNPTADDLFFYFMDMPLGENFVKTSTCFVQVRIFDEEGHTLLITSKQPILQQFHFSAAPSELSEEHLHAISFGFSLDVVEPMKADDFNRLKESTKTPFLFSDSAPTVKTLDAVGSRFLRHIVTYTKTAGRIAALFLDNPVFTKADQTLPFTVEGYAVVSARQVTIDWRCYDPLNREGYRTECEYDTVSTCRANPCTLETAPDMSKRSQAQPVDFLVVNDEWCVEATGQAANPISALDAGCPASTWQCENNEAEPVECKAPAFPPKCVKDRLCGYSDFNLVDVQCKDSTGKLTSGQCSFLTKPTAFEIYGKDEDRCVMANVCYPDYDQSSVSLSIAHGVITITYSGAKKPAFDEGNVFAFGIAIDDEALKLQYINETNLKSCGQVASDASMLFPCFDSDFRSLLYGQAVTLDEFVGNTVYVFNSTELFPQFFLAATPDEIQFAVALANDNDAYPPDYFLVDASINAPKLASASTFAAVPTSHTTDTYTDSDVVVAVNFAESAPAAFKDVAVTEVRVNFPDEFSGVVDCSLALAGKPFAPLTPVETTASPAEAPAVGFALTGELLLRNAVSIAVTCTVGSLPVVVPDFTVDVITGTTANYVLTVPTTTLSADAGVPSPDFFTYFTVGGVASEAELRTALGATGDAKATVTFDASAGTAAVLYEWGAQTAVSVSVTEALVAAALPASLTVSGFRQGTLAYFYCPDSAGTFEVCPTTFEGDCGRNLATTAECRYQSGAVAASADECFLNRNDNGEYSGCAPAFDNAADDKPVVYSAEAQRLRFGFVADATQFIDPAVRYKLTFTAPREFTFASVPSCSAGFVCAAMRDTSTGVTVVTASFVGSSAANALWVPFESVTWTLDARFTAMRFTAGTEGGSEAAVAGSFPAAFSLGSIKVTRAEEAAALAATAFILPGAPTRSAVAVTSSGLSAAPASLTGTVNAIHFHFGATYDAQKFDSCTFVGSSAASLFEVVIDAGAQAAGSTVVVPFTQGSAPVLNFALVCVYTEAPETLAATDIRVLFAKQDDTATDFAASGDAPVSLTSYSTPGFFGPVEAAVDFESDLTASFVFPPSLKTGLSAAVLGSASERIPGIMARVAPVVVDTAVSVRVAMKLPVEFSALAAVYAGSPVFDGLAAVLKAQIDAESTGAPVVVSAPADKAIVVSNAGELQCENPEGAADAIGDCVVPGDCGSAFQGAFVCGLSGSAVARGCDTIERPVPLATAGCNPIVSALSVTIKGSTLDLKYSVADATQFPDGLPLKLTVKAAKSSQFTFGAACTSTAVAPTSTVCSNPDNVLTVTVTNIAGTAVNTVTGSVTVNAGTVGFLLGAVLELDATFNDESVLGEDVPPTNEIDVNLTPLPGADAKFYPSSSGSQPQTFVRFGCSDVSCPSAMFTGSPKTSAIYVKFSGAPIIHDTPTCTVLVINTGDYQQATPLLGTRGDLVALDGDASGLYTIDSKDNIDFADRASVWVSCTGLELKSSSPAPLMTFVFTAQNEGEAQVHYALAVPAVTHVATKIALVGATINIPEGKTLDADSTSESIVTLVDARHASLTFKVGAPAEIYNMAYFKSYLVARLELGSDFTIDESSLETFEAAGAWLCDGETCTAKNDCDAEYYKAAKCYDGATVESDGTRAAHLCAFSEKPESEDSGCGTWMCKVGLSFAPCNDQRVCNEGCFEDKAVTVNDPEAEGAYKQYCVVDNATADAADFCPPALREHAEYAETCTSYETCQAACYTNGEDALAVACDSEDAWTPCGTTCVGSQTLNLVCTDKAVIGEAFTDKNSIPLSECNHDALDTSRACAGSECPHFIWRCGAAATFSESTDCDDTTGYGACDNPCGTGVNTRVARCAAYDDSETLVPGATSDSLCSATVAKPAESKPCEDNTCVGSTWRCAAAAGDVLGDAAGACDPDAFFDACPAAGCIDKSVLAREVACVFPAVSGTPGLPAKVVAGDKCALAAPADEKNCAAVDLACSVQDVPGGLCEFDKDGTKLETPDECVTPPAAVTVYRKGKCFDEEENEVSFCGTKTLAVCVLPTCGVTYDFDWKLLSSGPCIGECYATEPVDQRCVGTANANDDVAVADSFCTGARPEALPRRDCTSATEEEQDCHAQGACTKSPVDAAADAQGVCVCHKSFGGKFCNQDSTFSAFEIEEDLKTATWDFTFTPPLASNVTLTLTRAAPPLTEEDLGTFDAADLEADLGEKLQDLDAGIYTVTAATEFGTKKSDEFTVLPVCRRDGRTCQTGSGTCNDETGLCECVGDWSGERCSVSPCDAKGCNAGTSTCSVSDAGAAVCDCVEGASGDTCDEAECITALPTCANGGSRNIGQDPDSGDVICGDCDCAGHWDGDVCGTCTYQCVRGTVAATCDSCAACAAGYVGDNCECRSVTLILNFPRSAVEWYFSAAPAAQLASFHANATAALKALADTATASFVAGAHRRLVNTARAEFVRFEFDVTSSGSCARLLDFVAADVATGMEDVNAAVTNVKQAFSSGGAASNPAFASYDAASGLGVEDKACDASTGETCAQGEGNNGHIDELAEEPETPTDSSSSGLSQDEKIAVGVVVGVGGFLIILLIILAWKFGCCCFNTQSATGGERDVEMVTNTYDV